MNNTLILGFATFLVLFNGFIGHFFPPNGIMLTPVVLSLTTFLVCFGTNNRNVFLLGILTYFFVALNDILIKLFSGGHHDNVGLGLVCLMLFIGLIPTSGILLAAVCKHKEKSVINKIIAVALFIGFMIAHSQMFSMVGLGCYY